jgi:putative peptidoglycan lipid II flippase
MRDFIYYPVVNGLVLMLGFSRELVISSHYGLSPEIDIYVAVTCFHSFFGIQVGNATESVFVSRAGMLPTVAHIRWQLIRFFKDLTFFNLFTIPLILLFCGKILHIIVPGFSESQIQLGEKIIYLIAMSTIASNLSGAFRAALNMQKRFLPGFLAGGIVSGAIILSVVLLEKHIGIIAVPTGLVAGHFLVLAVYIRTWNGAWRSHSKFTQTIQAQDVPSASKAVGALLIAEMIYQCFEVTQRGFSSEIASGTIAAFSYAGALVAVPSALVANPMTIILFPRLAKAFSRRYEEGIHILLRYGGGLFAAGLILAGVIAVCSELIVSAVFVRGRFTTEDSFRTAELLRIMILALPFMSIGDLVRYALYSMAQYRASIYSNTLMWSVLAGAGFLLVPRHGASGLAWATVFAIAAQTISMLIMVFWKRSERLHAAA